MATPFLNFKTSTEFGFQFTEVTAHFCELVLNKLRECQSGCSLSIYYLELIDFGRGTSGSSIAIKIGSSFAWVGALILFVTGLN